MAHNLTGNLNKAKPTCLRQQGVAKTNEKKLNINGPKFMEGLVGIYFQKKQLKSKYFQVIQPTSAMTLLQT